MGRIVEIDILRTLVIISALLLHFNAKYCLGFLIAPSSIVQNCIFTVGGFFFFTAGYMARKIYLNRFLKNPKLCSKAIFIKGLKILSIYIVYVFFMHIFLDISIPKNVIAFLFSHDFFTKVLFTFGLLYMITPFFLFIYFKNINIIIFILGLSIILVLVYNDQWPLHYSLKILLLDRKLFLYPLIPSLVVYIVGFLISTIEISYKSKFSSLKSLLFMFIIISFHLFLSKYIYIYSDFIHKKQYFTLIESFTPYIAILMVRYICSIDLVSKYIMSFRILCIGIFSLHFYVISNLLLSLLHLSKQSAFFYKLFGLIGVFFLSYIFTYWRFKSIYGTKTLTKRIT